MIVYAQTLKGIYPTDPNEKNSICYMGNIEKYKFVFWYHTVQTTAKILKINLDSIDLKVLSTFQLLNDNRFYDDGKFSNRRWNQMSLPFQIRATAAIQYLAGCRYFSFPAYNKIYPERDLNNLLSMEFWKDILQFININAVLYLTNEQKCIFANKANII